MSNAKEKHETWIQDGLSGCLPYLGGTLKLSGGIGAHYGIDEAFVTCSLAEAVGHSRPQIQPRGRPMRKHSPQNIPCEEISEDDARTLFPDLVAHAFFNDQNSTVEAHVTRAFNFLVRLHRNEVMSNDDAAAVLSMIGYGTDSYVAIACKPMLILPYDFSQPHPPSPVEVQEIEEESLLMGFRSFNVLRKQIRDRRFFAGTARFPLNHILSFVFDRKLGELRIFDPCRAGRDSRAAAVAFSFAQLLYKLELPHNFDFYAMPLTPHDADSQWQCGYVAILCISQTVRNHVGVTRSHLELLSSLGRIHDSWGEAEGTWSDNGELLFSDWLPQPSGSKRLNSSQATGSEWLVAFFTTLILEEIGLEEIPVSWVATDQRWQTVVNPESISRRRRSNRLERQMTRYSAENFSSYGGFALVSHPSRVNRMGRTMNRLFSYCPRQDPRKSPSQKRPMVEQSYRQLSFKRVQRDGQLQGYCDPIELTRYRFEPLHDVTWSEPHEGGGTLLFIPRSRWSGQQVLRVYTQYIASINGSSKGLLRHNVHKHFIPYKINEVKGFLVHIPSSVWKPSSSPYIFLAFETNGYYNTESPGSHHVSPWLEEEDSSSE